MPNAVCEWTSMNLRITIRNTNAPSTSAAVESGNGICSCAFSTIATAAAARSKEPSTASLPTEPVSQALIEAENGPTDTSYHEKNNTAISVTAAPPTTSQCPRL